MKKLKLSIFLLLTLTTFSVVNAQEKVNNEGDRVINEKSKSSSKQTINISDKKPQKISYDGLDYYIIEGIWHIKFKNKLILRQAPKGAKISFLPKNGKTVVMGGKKYYKSNGVFYKTAKGGLYEVTRP